MCLYSSGRTTLSASGVLLPESLYDSAAAEKLSAGGDRSPTLVLTVASVVEPFLSSQHRDDLSLVRIHAVSCEL